MRQVQHDVGLPYRRPLLSRHFIYPLGYGPLHALEGDAKPRRSAAANTRNVGDVGARHEAFVEAGIDVTPWFAMRQVRSYSDLRDEDREAPGARMQERDAVRPLSL